MAKQRFEVEGKSLDDVLTQFETAKPTDFVEKSERYEVVFWEGEGKRYTGNEQATYKRALTETLKQAGITKRTYTQTARFIPTLVKMSGLYEVAENEQSAKKDRQPRPSGAAPSTIPVARTPYL